MAQRSCQVCGITGVTLHRHHWVKRRLLPAHLRGHNRYLIDCCQPCHCELEKYADRGLVPDIETIRELKELIS